MTAQRTIGIFGGSFNPPHVAHQMLMLYALETRALDAIWMIPTYHHPFAKALLDFEHRCRMCELAAAALGPRVEVSRVEGELARPVSRTLETIEVLRARHPDAGFRLVIGADILHESHKWHGWDRIVALAPPIVVGRGGLDGPGVDMPDVSSTTIRERLARGEPVDDLVPRGVARYIDEHGLYR